MAMPRPGPSFLFLLLVSLVASCFASPSFGQNNPSDSSFDNLAKLATAAREAGKSDEALDNYRRAVEIRPDWEEGLWYLGTLQYDADHFAEAIPALQKVVQMDPALGSAWNFLGLCEFETRDYPNSLTHLQKGQAVGTGDDPEIARVSKYHLALLLIRSAEFEQARAILSSSIANEASPQVKIALGLSLLRVPLLPQEVDPSWDALIQAAGAAASLLAHDETDKALISLAALVKAYPTTPYLHYAYGVTLASAGRDEEALIQQREERKISHKSSLAHIEISKIALRLRHHEEALRAAEAALQLAPESAAAYRALAESEQALGRKAKGVEHRRTAEKLAPETPKRDEQMVKLYGLHATLPAKEVAPSASANFDEVAQQAAASQAAGDGAEAIRNYRLALQMRPDWGPGWWNLAMLNYVGGHYFEAISALKVWVQRKPSDGTGWAVMGLSEFETKDYSNALIHLQRGQELGFGGSPESVELARYRLAILLNRDAQYERATELLAPQASSKSFGKEIQFALGMALLRIPLLPEQVEVLQRMAVQNAGEVSILLQNSKYDEALPRLRAMLGQYPAIPFLHYAYGVALVSMSQYDDAEPQFRQEQTISPRSELPYLRLASIALRTHRPADALPIAKRAVQLAPDSGEAHYVLGRTYLVLGQEVEAIKELETAKKISPGSPEVHFNLAKAYGKAKLQDKEEQERAIFTRLNELAQQQRGQRGSQSYGAARDTTDFSVTSVEPAAASSEPH